MAPISKITVRIKCDNAHTLSFWHIVSVPLMLVIIFLISHYYYFLALWEALKWTKTDPISSKTEHTLNCQFILASAEGFSEVNLEL